MNQKLAHFQKNQADEKSKQREDDFMRELEEANMINQAIENDDKMFNTYAQRCLSEWENQVFSLHAGKECDSDFDRVEEAEDAELGNTLNIRLCLIPHN